MVDEQMSDMFHMQTFERRIEQMANVVGLKK